MGRKELLVAGIGAVSLVLKQFLPDLIGGWFDSLLIIISAAAMIVGGSIWRIILARDGMRGRYIRLLIGSLAVFVVAMVVFFVTAQAQASYGNAAILLLSCVVGFMALGIILESRPDQGANPDPGADKKGEST